MFVLLSVCSLWGGDKEMLQPLLKLSCYPFPFVKKMWKPKK
jgi:hypothetical protein